MTQVTVWQVRGLTHRSLYSLEAEMSSIGKWWVTKHIRVRCSTLYNRLAWMPHKPNTLIKCNTLAHWEGSRWHYLAFQHPLFSLVLCFQLRLSLDGLTFTFRASATQIYSSCLRASIIYQYAFPCLLVMFMPIDYNMLSLMWYILLQ